MALIHEVIPLSVKAYDKLIEDGILKPDSRVELIRGRLVPMPAISGERVTQVRKLFKKLDRIAEQYNKNREWKDQVLARQGAPIVLNNVSKPQPDIALVVADKTTASIGDIDDCYGDRAPSADETILVVEVSNAALRSAREERLSMFADSCVREVWILDMDRKDVTVHLHPTDGQYKHISTHTHGELRPAALPEYSVILEDLFVPSLSSGSSMRSSLS